MIINPAHEEEALVLTVKTERKFIEEPLRKLGILGADERIEDYKPGKDPAKQALMDQLSRELGKALLEKLGIPIPDDRLVFTVLDVVD